MNVANLTPDDCRALLAKLTAREREVTVSRVLRGSIKAAARELGIAVQTVDIHCCRIRDKLGAQSFEQVAVVATKAGLL